MDYRGTLETSGDPAVTRAWATGVRIAMVGLGALQLLILLRIGLLLLGSDPGGLLAAGVMRATDPFVEPFRSLLKLPAIPSTATEVVDGAAVIAFIVWTAIEAIVLSYVAPRIDTRRIYWPREYDRRYGTIAAMDVDHDQPDARIEDVGPLTTKPEPNETDPSETGQVDPDEE